MPTKPTIEQLKQSIHVICKVIGQIPCFHLYEEYIARRFSATEPEIALRAIIHNAAIDSTLISLRCFNEFFGSSRQEDDIRASDFPGVAMKPFLSPAEARDIHKYLAHVTVTRSDIVTKPWFLDDMAIRGLQHGVALLSVIENSFPPPSVGGLAELIGVRDTAHLLIQKLRKAMNPAIPDDAVY